MAPAGKPPAVASADTPLPHAKGAADSAGLLRADVSFYFLPFINLLLFILTCLGE